MRRSGLTLAELEPQDSELIDAAKKALRRSYRVGRHTVGAAILCSSHRIHTGVNAEKCAYGACAESRAIATAFGRGDREVLAIVVLGKQSDGYAVLRPCDDCQQSLAQRAPDAMVIVCHDGKIVKTKLRHLRGTDRTIALENQRGKG